MILANRFFSYIRLMRLDRPVGIILFLWPTLWALWLAAGGIPQWSILGIFVAGVIIMRSAGCVINDIADRNFDRQVKRTRHRPLATGEISVKSAVILFIGLLSLAAILLMPLNLLTVMLAFIVLGLACLYPLTKRWTYWPQLVLGSTVAFAAPMAFAAQLNALPYRCWIIYLIAVLWPLMYDTQYAMVDREDDLQIGIKSTAIQFGRFDVLAIAILQAIIIILLAISGWLFALHWPYFAALGVAGLLFIYQIYLIRHRDPDSCFRAFLNNQWVGLSIFLGIFLSYF